MKSLGIKLCSSWKLTIPWPWTSPWVVVGVLETGSIPGRWDGQKQSPQAPEDGETADLLSPEFWNCLTVVFWSELG